MADESLDIPDFLRNKQNLKAETAGSESTLTGLLSADTGAVFSPDRDYRYLLWRRWEHNAPYCLFIGLNPSTANERDDDPTIRRCKRFADDWGFGAVVMANLFALRATDPKVMLAHSEPIGIDNDVWLQDLARGAGVIVCAWGANGGHQQRDGRVNILLQHYDLKCLGTTKAGKPRHPLYIKADKQLEPLGR